MNKLPLRLLINPRAGAPGVVVLPEAGYRRARSAITSWPGYAPTKLVDLPWAAAACGVAAVRIKDESGRFGLGSFKALGGAYAVARLVGRERVRRGVDAGSITVTSATDGNHGRAVAWGAQRAGCRAIIFIHATVSAGREAAIAGYGAEVRRVRGNYDDAVRACSAAAAEHGWNVVSDTSWPGYVTVPAEVMQGYRLMVDEALAQWPAGPPPTHSFIQGGVGAVAASVSVHLRTRLDPRPLLAVVEPEHAACLLASAELGEMTSIAGALDTVMAGLACGEPSLLAWQELERGADAFLAIPDVAAISTLRLLARHGLTIGESGVAGLAGLLLAAADPAARAALNLTGQSRVLLFGTEGATDPALYAAFAAEEGPP